MIKYLILIACFMLAGCQTLDTKIQLSAKELLASKSVITILANTGNELCKTGKLNQEKCNKIKDAYNKSKVVYDAASDAMVIALSVGATDESWEKFQITLALFTVSYNDFHKLSTELGLIKGAKK